MSRIIYLSSKILKDTSASLEKTESTESEKSIS